MKKYKMILIRPKNIFFLLSIFLFNICDAQTIPSPEERWAQVGLHLGHLADESGQFGFGTAVAQKRSTKVGPVDVGVSQTERFYGTKSTGTSTSIGIKASLIEGKYKIGGSAPEVTVGGNVDAINIAFDLAATAASSLGPGAVALVIAIKNRIPDNVRKNINVTGDFGVDVGLTSYGTPFLRIYTGFTLGVNLPQFFPNGGNLKGTVKEVRTWQIFQREHLRQLGIPFSDQFTFLTASTGGESGNYFIGSGEPDEPVFYLEDLSKYTNTFNPDSFFSNDLEFTMSDGTSNIFTYQSPDFWTLPNNNLSGANFKIFTDWKIGKYSFSDFNLGGVDFSGLSVSGIDIDDAQKTINFIFKADAKQESAGNNFKTEANLLKKVFLQALTIPNDAQWVSLDRTVQNNQTIGHANADEVFKQTDMSLAFFAADAQMKYDLYQELAQLGEVKGVFNLWLSIFRDTDPAMYAQLQSKKMTFPNVFMRGLIMPKTTSGNKDKKVFIEDATYQLKYFIDDINYGPFGNVSLPVDEALYFYDRSIEFENALSQKLGDAAAKVESRINLGSTAEYSKLKRLLPAIVAAQWYKYQYKNTPSSLFYSLIDTKDLSVGHTGYSLSAPTPFDQAFWNTRADQILGYETFTINNVTYRVQVRGGIENQDTKINQLASGISITQKDIISSVNANAHIAANGKEYVYGGAPSFHLPEFSIGYINQTKQQHVGTSWDIEDDLVEGIESGITVNAINSGNADASGIAVALYEMQLNASGQVIKTRFVQAQTAELAKFSQKELYFTYTPGGSGKFKLAAYINTNTANYSVTPQKELIAYNNLWEKTIFVKPQSPQVYIFPVNPKNVYANEGVEILAQSYDPRGLPLTYQWSSNLQGTISNQASLVLSNIQPGTHNITLKVTNSSGQSGIREVTATFGDCPTDTASFDAPYSSQGGIIKAGHVELNSSFESGAIMVVKSKSTVLNPGFYSKPGSNLNIVAFPSCGPSVANNSSMRIGAQVSDKIKTNRVVTSRLSIYDYPVLQDKPIRKGTDMKQYKEELFSLTAKSTSSNLNRQLERRNSFENQKPYPVPFVNKLYIPNLNGESAEIVLRDMLGKVLLRTNITGINSSYPVEIDASTIPDGNFILMVNTSKTSNTYKVLKIK